MSLRLLLLCRRLYVRCDVASHIAVSGPRDEALKGSRITSP